jgi:predicted signal transduction protein with EAL and GGDEF domain
VLELFREPFRLASGDHWVTPSIGIAVQSRDAPDADALVRNADTAMYRSKAAGGNTFRFYDESMNREVARRLALERGLRRALLEDELVLHFQPRIDTRTGSVVSAEALLRWTSAELGVVAPTELIAVAEETGLIREVGMQTLLVACESARRWEDSGLGRLGVSVNVSVHELRDHAFQAMVKKALFDTGLDPKRLELEITETALMHDERTAVDVLDGLRQIGVRVSLDDFGTGFSSLSLLKNTPVDALKIDRSFVRDVTRDKDDAAIVAAILAMAEQLAIDVVAEGVETLRQRDFLSSRGCHEMQGFLFARPLSPEEFAALLRKVRGGSKP